MDIDASNAIVSKRYFDLETIQLNVLAAVNVKERLGDLEHYFFNVFIL